MELTWKEESEGVDSQMNGSDHLVPSSVTSRFDSTGTKLIWKKPQRHHFLDDIVSSYVPCDDNEFDLFIGCEEGLFHVSQHADETESYVKWKCIAKREDSFYQEFLRNKHKEECLAALGVGKVTEEMPTNIQKKIYELMRPETSADAIQATSPMLESGSQTKWCGLRTQTTASQTIQQTADRSVQAKPTTIESGTCTSLTDSGIQMTPETDQDTSLSSQNDQRVTLQVHIPASRWNGNGGEPVTITFDGVTSILSKKQSNSIERILRRTLKNIVTIESGYAIDANLMLCTKEVGSNEFGSGDLKAMWHGAEPKVGNVVWNHCESLKKPVISSTEQMSAGEGVVRYHAELPVYKHNEKYLSRSSPFGRFGYNIIGSIPPTLKHIRIPIVCKNDITFQKGRNGSEVLGSGSFGSVYLAKHEQYQFDVCVKEFEMDSCTIYDIHHEAKLLLYLQTTKFVPICLGLMESPFVSSDFSLVQECFAHGCTLRMLLKNPPLVFVKKKWIAICYQLFWGLKVIHEKQVLLNDIKSDNILVDYDSNDIMSNIRFIDLGLATYRRGYRFCNEPAYLEQFENYAPEIRQGYHSTPASDLYAVGYIVDKISEAFHILEIDPIAQSCTVEDPNERLSCYSVLDKLEDIMEIM
ncbi:uncharacterized protein LOC132547711 [Ylistrum balloti]|uniref:uncharacterized protein LOC132547711 n=1 Tax=Ylistrum balloti TaxID=509963 RepID=UPI00290588B3|nr:uncharacterized protein LOC132547711 [Ylistrum balloti]